MNEYVSPVDGHRHYGDAARAECAVCRLEADRDRLSEAWAVEHDAADAAAAAVGAMAERLSATLAERDRLQRIIADVFVALYPPTPGDGTVHTIEHTEMPAHVRQAVAERNELRAVVDALREWQKARQRLQMADTVDDEDRATEALDVIGQDVLAKLAALDGNAEATDG